MKYINAEKVLPQELVRAIQMYVKGDLLYIPNEDCKKKWGEKSGSKQYYIDRNNEIKKLYKEGQSILQICEMYGLAFDTVRKILYS